jgi:hypothetical protein
MKKIIAPLLTVLATLFVARAQPVRAQPEPCGTNLATMCPTKTCWFEKPADRGPVAMSLYVAGMNHARKDVHKAADKEGVAELVKAITDSVPKDQGDRVVVAFSESLHQAGCDAGNKIGPDKVVQSGECVALALEKHFGGEFKYTPWHWWEGTIGGSAVITGRRWKVNQSEHLRKDQPHGRALEVYLQDSTDPSTRVAIYVFHTRDHAEGAEDVKNVVALVKTRMGKTYLAPLFVGDFNANIGSPVAGQYFSEHFQWWNQGNECNDDETPEKLGFSMEQQILHIFGGKRGGPTDFSCSSGRLVPLNLKYSRGGPAKVAHPHDGIWLPNVAHNVVAMDFEVVKEKETNCPTFAAYEACLETCATALTSCQQGCQSLSGNRRLTCLNRCGTTNTRCETNCANRHPH